jgi:hypothetical protein
MSIHDSLDMEAFSIFSSALYGNDVTCPRILANPLLPVKDIALFRSSSLFAYLFAIIGAALYSMEFCCCFS